jgi:hypothetical protein
MTQAAAIDRSVSVPKLERDAGSGLGGGGGGGGGREERGNYAKGLWA